MNEGIDPIPIPMKSENVPRKADDSGVQSVFDKEDSEKNCVAESLKASQSPIRLTDSISNGMESDLDENMYPLW